MICGKLYDFSLNDITLWYYSISYSSTSKTLFPTVPLPRLYIPQPINPAYAGSVLTLNCSIQLSTDVDSLVTVRVTWKRNGMILTNTTWRMISDTIGNNSSALYHSQLMFSPLQLNTDNGVYLCEAYVDTDIRFVLGSGAHSNSVSLHSTGIRPYQVNSQALLL